MRNWLYLLGGQLGALAFFLTVAMLLAAGLVGLGKP
jgi:hypothetical protein